MHPLRSGSRNKLTLKPGANLWYTPIMTTTRFKGLIFDMDGTLTVPTLDFNAMRNEIGLPEGDLAEEVFRLPPEEQQKAWAIIERHETEAIRDQRLQDNTEPFLASCRAADIKLGIVTRNERRSVDALCSRYGLEFDSIVTREFQFIKPHPAPILHILKQWNLLPHEVLMIGDYIHDIDCGRAAGTKTCFYYNQGSSDHGKHADFVARSIEDLNTIVLEQTSLQ